MPSGNDAIAGNLRGSLHFILFRKLIGVRQHSCTFCDSDVTASLDSRLAAFLEEKSLRADVARTLIRMVSVSARISTELEELKRSQKMSSLWKLHADSIVVLLDMANSSTEDAGSVAKQAEQSGSGTAGKSVHESVKKLRNRCDLAAKTLANVS